MTHRYLTDGLLPRASELSHTQTVKLLTAVYAEPLAKQWNSVIDWDVVLDPGAKRITPRAPRPPKKTYREKLMERERAMYEIRRENARRR